MAAQVSRRVFLKVAGNIAGAATLAACAPAKKGLGKRGNAAAQLVYQDWRTDYFSAMAQRLLEEFHATHSNIHVFYTPDPPNLTEKMLSDFQAESAPDVFAGCCDYFSVWAQKGYLLDLRPYIEAELKADDRDDWDPAHYRALQLPDGAQYALPKHQGALAIYYNKDLFDKYKVPHPAPGWTHDDYRSAMLPFAQRRSSDADELLWGSMFDVSWERIQAHVNAWGGHFVDPNDAMRSMMSEQPALEAFEWLRKRMWEDHAMASRLDAQNLNVTDAFCRRRLAMVEDGSWSLKRILDSAPFRVGVAPFPGGPAGQTTISSIDGFAIYNGTRYPEDAWEFMKFLISPRYNRAMIRSHLLQPARASLVNEWLTEARNQYPEKTREINLEVFTEARVKGYAAAPEIFNQQEAAQQLAAAAWERIYTLGRAPVSLMSEVSAQIDAAQAPSQRSAREQRREV